MNIQGTKNMWRWYIGGGVVAVAVVLGCATAIDFKDSGREAGTKKMKRDVAAVPGQEPRHNGGKPTMPVTASFDGDSIVNITVDSNLIVAITADADISNVVGIIEGMGGLSGLVSQPLDFTEIAAGETRSITVRVPAKTGSLAVRIEGLVQGYSMSTTLELKVINPKQAASAANSKSGEGLSHPEAHDLDEPPTVDATGQRVQSMKAREN